MCLHSKESRSNVKYSSPLATLIQLLVGCCRCHHRRRCCCCSRRRCCCRCRRCRCCCCCYRQNSLVFLVVVGFSSVPSTQAPCRVNVKSEERKRKKKVAMKATLESVGSIRLPWKPFCFSTLVSEVSL